MAATGVLMGPAADAPGGGKSIGPPGSRLASSKSADDGCVAGMAEGGAIDSPESFEAVRVTPSSNHQGARTGGGTGATADRLAAGADAVAAVGIKVSMSGPSGSGPAPPAGP
jgi:hypothetical protein